MVTLQKNIYMSYKKNMSENDDDNTTNITYKLKLLEDEVRQAKENHSELIKWNNIFIISEYIDTYA